MDGLLGVYIVEIYSFLQLAYFVSFDKVFSTKLIEINNIYNNIRKNLLSLRKLVFTPSELEPGLGCALG